MLNPNDFLLFDPLTSAKDVLPDSPGVYVVALRHNSVLPLKANMTAPQIQHFTFNGEEFEVIYVGKSSKSLRTRDFAQHFNGTAGRSTLRKSIGCLMGFKLIPRDANSPLNGKTTFNDEDERTLTEWMANNLILFCCASQDFTALEIELIKEYNPPLNLQGNFYKINADFREKLSYLRKVHCPPLRLIDLLLMACVIQSMVIALYVAKYCGITPVTVLSAGGKPNF